MGQQEGAIKCTPQRCKSWRASEPPQAGFPLRSNKRQGWSCNRLPRSLDNTGSEVLQLSWKVNTRRKTEPFLEITVGDIQKMVETCLYSAWYLSFSYLFPYCLCNIGVHSTWSFNGYIDIISGFWCLSRIDICVRTVTKIQLGEIQMMRQDRLL